MDDLKAGLPIGWTDLWKRCVGDDWRTINTMRLADALEFAFFAHAGQTRKDGTSFAIHPIRVLSFIQTALDVNDVTTRVGALLHDAVEDTPLALQDNMLKEIELKFGPDVASLVKELTNDESLPFKEKKAKMIEKARSFSDRARIIKTSDRIDNLLDMVRQGHQKWLSRYLPESRKLLASLRAGIEPADELDEWTITDLSTVSCSACNYLESVIDFAETFRLSNSNTGEQS